jgi:hypothetical protein
MTRGAARTHPEHAAGGSGQPAWLANLGTMFTHSHNPHVAGLNWFSWDKPDGKAYVRQAFATASSYLVEAGADEVSSSGVETGWPAVPVTMESYRSAWDLISALEPGAFGNQTCGTGLYSDVGAVMYDDEDWAGTPPNERHYPGYYVAMIAYYVHRYNQSHPARRLKLFVAPALDLSEAVVPGNIIGSGGWSYLADDVPELVSAPSTTWNPGQDGEAGTDGNFGSYVADGVEVQAQQLEPVVTGKITRLHVTYQYLVRRAVAQIAIGDPGATVFAGLTTNDTGGDGAEATVAQVKTAASKVQGLVSGFWLNDPAQSGKCPSCTGTYPNIADGSLDAIDASPGW